MKKVFTIFLMSSLLFACKTMHMATPAPNANSKPAVDTALQGDKMKDPTKQ